MTDDNTKEKIKSRLKGIDSVIKRELSLNTTISLYDIIGEFYSDEQNFELKIAKFFTRMPDKLKLLHMVIGDISSIRREIMKGGDKTADLQNFVEDYFSKKSSELNKQYKGL